MLFSASFISSRITSTFENINRTVPSQLQEDFTNLFTYKKFRCCGNFVLSQNNRYSLSIVFLEKKPGVFEVETTRCLYLLHSHLLADHMRKWKLHMNNRTSMNTLFGNIGYKCLTSYVKSEVFFGFRRIEQ